MTTINAVNTTLSGQTGTGDFVGSVSPTLTGPAANNFLEGYTTTATATGTTTLTASSNRQQFFTGTAIQTIFVPVYSTLILGQSYYIVNSSTLDVTVRIFRRECNIRHGCKYICYIHLYIATRNNSGIMV